MPVDQDATSGKYLPSSSAQWTTLLSGTGLSNPTSLYLCQESSGDLADSIGSMTLTKSLGASVTYQNAVTGWSRKGIRTTTDVEGYFRNNTFGNVNANSFTVLLIAKVASAPVGDPATLMRFGGTFNDDACLEISTTPRLSVGEGDGTRSAGSTDPTGAVHYYWLRVDDSGNAVDGFLDSTKVSGGTQACNGTEFGIGGDFNETWYPPTCDFMYCAVWSGALGDGDITAINDLIDNGADAPTLAEGTTADALAAGSGSFKFTAVIEGCKYILSDATAQLAIDAWADETGTHHRTEALGDCLFVTGDQSQQILDWRNPFPRGGSLMLHVSPDSAGTFRKFAFRRKTSVRSELTATIDCDDTTLTVKSPSTFTSSGDLHIGTECIGYAAKDGNSFTGLVRGKYPALARTDGTDNDGLGHHHRVGANDLEILLNPIVSEVPRRWEGKWVAIYLHKYDASIPALNSKADALRVFAGKIVSLVDDPATGCTVIEVKHALDVVSEHTIGGRDQWSGTIRNTIRLVDGMTFTLKDTSTSGAVPTNKTATDMVVGGSGGSDPPAGDYTFIEIFEFLNGWFTTESGANNLNGIYSIGFYYPGDNTVRCGLWWQLAGADVATFRLTMPQLVAARLGYDTDEGIGLTVNGFNQSVIKDQESDGDLHVAISDLEVLRYVGSNAGLADAALIDDGSGIAVDQYAYLPGSCKPASSTSLTEPTATSWGIFLVDESFLALASFVPSSDPDTLYDIVPIPDQFGLPGYQTGGGGALRIPMRQNGPQDTPIRQIFVLEGGLGDLLLRIFFSTGTNAYNSPYDTLAYGLGIGVPGEILPSTFRASCNALPSADAPVVLLIDKQIKLSTLLAGELVVRRSFLRWNTDEGCLEFKTWESPTESNSVATLTEANKASPSGTQDHQLSVTAEDTSWSVPTANIRFNRSLKGDPAGNDQYRDTLTIADKAALDDAGGDGPSINIDCRGTFGDFMQTGQTAESLSAVFMSTMPYFSQPAMRMSRSIDQRFYTAISIGDIVLVQDDYAIDPETGERGLTKYGIVIRHRFSIGGFVPNSDNPQPQGGEVDVFFIDGDDVASYVPAAQVDDTATNGGYDAGDPFYLTLYPHKYSEASENEDGASFVENDEIVVIEIDPADPADPLVMTTTVVGYDSATNKLQVAELSGDTWDPAKKYRVVFRDYADCQTTQQVKTFQADDADGMIQDLRSPFVYGSGGGSGSFTLWTSSDPVELPPDAAYGDGVGRDVGHEIALARLLNNLVMYKTGVSSPCLSTSVMSFYIGGGSADWCLVQCRPVHLGSDISVGGLYRKVAVAPHFRSNDGSSASVRVTLSRTPPTSSSYFDVNRGSVISETTFTTTSTTFATPTPVEITAPKASDGIVWVYVEVSGLAETWGLAHLQETEIRSLFQITDLEP